MTDIHIAYTTRAPQEHDISVTLSSDDRRRHMYVIGQTGTGKTTFLQNCAMQDIILGSGMAFIDVHGDCVEELLHHIPRHRIKDVVYFNPADTHPVGFNPLYDVPASARHLVIDDIVSSFRALWAELWSTGRMEYITINALASLIAYQHASLLDMKRIFIDRAFRERVLAKVTDKEVLNFWRHEFEAWDDRYRTDAVASIQNKLGQLLLDHQLRRVFMQPKRLNFRRIMDERKIFIANLAKGSIGEKRSALFASLLLSHFYAAALTRADQTEDTRVDFYLYIDEFQNAATITAPQIMSEARKYRLNLTVAHQYIAQLPEHILAAVFGTVGTIISFRVGRFDAERLSKEFFEEMGASDLGMLNNFEIVYRKLSAGHITTPRRVFTYGPCDLVARPASKEVVLKRSRTWYGSKA